MGRDSYITSGVLEQILDGITDAIKERDVHIKNLQARVAELEQRPVALAYGGTWTRDQESKKGYFYTDCGSVWFCKEATCDRPGEGDAWTLAVKRGADARRDP